MGGIEWLAENLHIHRSDCHPPTAEAFFRKLNHAVSFPSLILMMRQAPVKGFCLFADG